MNEVFAAIVALLLLGSVPEPLLVGIVRDQYGAPIVGATVVTQGQQEVRGTTGDDGTVALRVGDARQIRVTCAYCVPTTARVSSDGTAVAIVHRYDALERTVPSGREISQLPYVHVESDLSLAPYVVLDDAPSPFPAPTLSDRGLESGGGLLIDNGVANYDPVANASPFLTIPAAYTRAISEQPASAGYAYGDVAGGGIYAINPFGDSSSARLYVGSGTAVRASTVSAHDAFALGYSGNALQQRERSDVSFFKDVGNGTLEAGASASAGTNPTFGYMGTSERSAFTAAQVDYHEVTDVDVHAVASLDRGSYAITSIAQPYHALWSDGSVDIAVRGLGNVAPFVAFGERSSSGAEWQADPLADAVLRVASAKMLAGVQATTRAFAVTAAAGSYDISYDGGSPGNPRLFNAGLPTSLLSIATREGRWFASANASTNFRLPTAVEAFDDKAPGYLDPMRTRTYEVDTGYTDDYRFRVGLTAAMRHESGFESGDRTSIGANLAWQVSPLISLRSWMLHIDPRVTLALQAQPYLAYPQIVGVGSTWLTYDRPNGVRVDAIWRHDLEAWKPFSHLDAAVSVPYSPHLSLWAGTSVRYGRRYVFVGLRL